MASVEVTKIITFCDKCKRRKGPVSATHRGCGGDEANCTCEEEVAVPESQESDSVHRSPLRDESDDDSKADEGRGSVPWVTEKDVESASGTDDLAGWCC